MSTARNSVTPGSATQPTGHNQHHPDDWGASLNGCRAVEPQCHHTTVVSVRHMRAGIGRPFINGAASSRLPAGAWQTVPTSPATGSAAASSRTADAPHTLRHWVHQQPPATAQQDSQLTATRNPWNLCQTTHSCAAGKRPCLRHPRATLQEL